MAFVVNYSFFFADIIHVIAIFALFGFIDSAKKKFSRNFAKF
jgi:hypothetical protein